MEQHSRDFYNNLALKWLKGTITKEEKKLYKEWYDSDGEKKIPWNGADLSEEDLRKRLLRNINEKKERGK
jgi:transmembrane sensor